MASGSLHMLALFGTTIFLSAALLFCVEPMIARMLLPLLGGAPAVWVTCMLFFQLALLLGYGYAHGTLSKLGPRRQAMVQMPLLLAPLLVLPIAFDPQMTAGWPPGADPSWRLLLMLTMAVGLPFLVLSTTSPLLQAWLAHASGRDPYFLYGASNLGSMLALLAYPAILERHLGLRAQSQAWRWGYVILIVMMASCAGAMLWTTRHAATPSATEAAATPDRPLPIQLRQRIRWLLLAFVPSSFLLGTTTYVTTDVAAIPLFWVMPLAVYLATFIIVFARTTIVPHALVGRVMPFVVTAATLVMLSEMAQPGWLIIGVHLLLLFVAALVCHGALARDRPPAARLTEFYLWIAAGGVLGGVFNSLVAPVLFDRIVEYPLMIVIACMCRDGVDGTLGERVTWTDLRMPAVVGALTVALILGTRYLGMHSSSLAVAFILGPPLLVNYATLDKPIRFALGIGAVFSASALHQGSLGRIVHTERDFFGVVRVSYDRSGRFVQIVHGNTVHGRQHLDRVRRDEPTAYYHRTGPIGQVIAVYEASAAPLAVGVIGLGAGGLAAYARPTERWTFYEIDPIVIHLATDPAYFSFLSDMFPDRSRLSIVLGDARVELARAPQHGYGLLVLDAFSSDAIPMHLVTREALSLYVDKLAPDGILALHISNQYLDLHPVFADLAADASLVAWARDDQTLTPPMEQDGKSGSQWIAMARTAATLEPLLKVPGWARLEAQPGRKLWTDDFSDLLGVYRW